MLRPLEDRTKADEPCVSKGFGFRAYLSPEKDYRFVDWFAKTQKEDPGNGRLCTVQVGFGMSCQTPRHSMLDS